MLHYFKRFLAPALLAVAIHPAMSFSLLGPNNEAWQIPELGYNPLPSDGLPTAPKNLGNEYRRNTPVMYYTFDANFLDFFGSNGVVAVEQAFQVLNNLTNVSSYSDLLTEFPLSSLRANYKAEVLRLADLKSYTLHLMMEQLGLAEPERFVWNLRKRVALGPRPCPDDMVYFLVRRNFGITTSPLNQVQASSYVNGALYSYFIYEDCGTGPLPTADAVEFPADPLDITFTSVASGVSASVASQGGGTRTYVGKFFTGLTRDDVAGLRYLLRGDNYNFESTGPNAVSLVTNGTPQLLQTFPLSSLADTALYSDSAGLAPLGVQSTSSNYFVTAWVTNLVPYLTNHPFDPVFALPRVAFLTNRFQIIENRFVHQFQNIHTVVFRNGRFTSVPITNISIYTNRSVQALLETTVGLSSSPFAPVGTFGIATNVTLTWFATNRIAGEYFIMPTNACEVVILAPQLTFTNITSTIVFSITNTLTISNSVSVSNVTESVTRELVEFSTNHVYSVLPVACLQSNIVLAGGIERMKFVRRDFDSLIGRFFEPFTNEYTLNVVTNNRVAPMRVQRLVAAPDFVFSATDTLTGGPTDDTFSIYSRNVTFNSNGIAAPFGGIPAPGPGTIEPPSVITFNSSGEVYYNFTRNAFLFNVAETNQILLWQWGSFDGTTNEPVVYPNGTSIAMIENMLFMSIDQDFMPTGLEGAAYFSQQFTAQGGSGPYRWSIVPEFGGPPPGLTLRPDGTITGVATQRGTYDFVVRVTDAHGRFVDRGYTIKILW